MPRTPQFTSWVVYETIQPGKPKMTTVCGQPEWDALDLTPPNYHVLIRSGITNEGVAERLARSGAIVEKVKEVRKKPVVPLSDAADVSGSPGQLDGELVGTVQAVSVAHFAQSPPIASCVKG